MKDEEEPFISRLSAFAFKAIRDVWLIWLVLAALTSLPYIAASLRTPASHVFSGVLTAYDDTFTYFAWMRQGVDGHLLMCDPFTSEPQQCEFFLPLWYLLGLIARVTHLPIALTFHAARLFAALWLLIAARGIAGGVMKSRRRVRYSLWLYALSGGVGWLLYAFKNRANLLEGAVISGAVDLDLPEAIAFRSVFSQVHFAVGVALVCGAITLFFGALIEKKPSRALVAGALVSLLSVVHPYMVFVVCGVIGAALLTLPWLTGGRKTPPLNYRGSARSAVAFCAGMIPGVSYAAYLNWSNEVLREWLRVTDTFSPPPWEYALGFGVVGVLATVGFRLMWNGSAPYGRMLLIWVFVHAALLYAPVRIQRRFVEGLQVPLSIAASVALFWIARRSLRGPAAARRRKLLLGGAIAFASLTNVGFIIGQLMSPGPVSGSTDSRRYISADLVHAFDWLRSNAEPDAVLFSSYLTGNVAPSMTGLRVFLGHYAQTLYGDEKGAQVASFFANTMSDEAARVLFSKQRVRYVVYGQFERELSNSFVPPNWLKVAYRNRDIEVFEVNDSGGSGPP
jgi:hypothetical protein